MNKRALLLVNRHARKGQKLASLAASQLQTLGFNLVEEPIESPAHLSGTILRYRDQVDLVIIGGGDGTLNGAIAALIETQLPLGIVPLGTANDLARTLGIPPTIPEACQIIAAGNTQKIDLGWVNGCHFFNVASLGLSVKITRNLTKDVKRRWGVLAYAVTAVRALQRSRPFRAEIRIGDHIETVKTVQIAVGNGRFYGGGMAVAADAAINDERLDLYSLDLKHWWQMLVLLPAFHRGQHASASWVHSWEGQEFYVQTKRPRSINTDGEITTSTPAHFRVIPKALSVIVPQKLAKDSEAVGLSVMA
jgi:YegS/Rv2252/BmrU family lipid kinase